MAELWYNGVEGKKVLDKRNVPWYNILTMKNTKEINNKLYSAAFDGRADETLRLIGEGADVSFINMDREFTTPLHAAASGGFVDVMETLLAANADVNARDYYGCTPLHAAASNGHDAACTFLIEHGANIEKECVYGSTPLICAVRDGHLSTVEIMLDRGANPNPTDYGPLNPMYFAAKLNDQSIMKLLVARGGNVNAGRDDGSCTPLHAAVFANNADNCRLLIEMGADVNANDEYNKKPIDYAKMYNSAEIVNVLSSYVKNALEVKIDNIRKHASFYQKMMYEKLRKEHDGIADKKTLKNILVKHILEKDLARFKYYYLERHNAWVFADSFSNEVVNWLGQNVCIDLYDLVVTKKAYGRLKKFVSRAEEVEALDDNTVKVWPKQWNN